MGSIGNEKMRKFCFYIPLRYRGLVDFRQAGGYKPIFKKPKEQPIYVTRHGDKTLYGLNNHFFLLRTGEFPGICHTPSRNEIWLLLADAGWNYKRIEHFKPFQIDQILCEKYSVGKTIDGVFHINSYGIRLLINRIRKEKRHEQDSE